MAIVVNSAASAFRRTASLPSSTAFSMWGWFYLRVDGNTSTGFMALTDSTGSAPSSYTLVNTDSDGTTLKVWSLGVGTTLAVLTPSTWYFAAMTNAGTGGTDLNGYVRALTANSLTSASRSGDTFTPALAEWGNNGFDEYLDGRIHACGMADVVLSAEELLAISYFHEPQLWGIRSLNVFYPTIESVNTNATVDRSGNGRNATATVGALADSPPLLWMPWRQSQPLFAAAGGGGDPDPVLGRRIYVMP